MAVQQARSIREIVGQFGDEPGRLMDMAQAVVLEHGYLSEQAIAEIAAALKIPRGRVRDMVSFYAFLPRASQATNVIRLCNAVAERMQGADEVGAALEEALGIPFGGATSDGAFSLTYTPCIGLSDQAPSALINGHPVTSLTAADVPAIIQALRDGRPAPELPQSEVEPNIRERGPVVFTPMKRGAALRRALTMNPKRLSMR